MSTGFEMALLLGLILGLIVGVPVGVALHRWLIPALMSGRKRWVA